MKGTDGFMVLAVVVIAVFVVYLLDPTFFGLLGRREGFDSPKMNDPNYKTTGPAGGPAAGASPGKPVAAVTAANPNVSKTVSTMQGVPAGQDLKVQPQVQPQPQGVKMASGAAAAKKEGFADLASFEGPANFSTVEPPAGCYPRDQLTPAELLPLDQTSIYAEQNPMGPGSLKGKNFLSAGALIGVNTVGQSLRNANLQLRSEPPNPQVPVSIFMNSTISPDISHRPLEIGA